RTDNANVQQAEVNGKRYVLGRAVRARYRSGKSLLESIGPYNQNPSVNHTNLHETDEPMTKMRHLGAEIELGLVHADGVSPSEDEMQAFIQAYYRHGLRAGIYPHLDREACQYQVEAHIAPSIGYEKTRKALEGIMTALVASGEETHLRTAVLSSYPTESDFRTTDHPKVQTAVDLMQEVNNMIPAYKDHLEAAKRRYSADPNDNIYVHMFRCQGCHIHIDLAGRSEALGLFTFYTMLRSATAVANGAVLKGGPFVNGTCDAELLDTREYLRGTTATGRYLDIPSSPHLTENGLMRYGELLRLERANAVARAMLYEDHLGVQLSVPHNPIGRLRPDLGSEKRVCTVESTGMPASVSASRMAAVLTDLEFSHAIIEDYFRKYGCDLGPMYEDKTLLAILGPLDNQTFIDMHNYSDREGTDMVLTTAAGTQMTLAEFYDMKRLYMHRMLADIDRVTGRDIDEVYTSMVRMLQPPSGHTAQTVQQFITDPKLRSTGNWGRILRNAFIEAGGVPGTQNAPAVLNVVNQIHEAMCERYLHNTHVSVSGD
ncbi:MAG: hypothetical protein H7175_04420, partial [Burkholderiales bacterium]|nr:hypothetical protein [Anaerolineae bacterium]